MQGLDATDVEKAFREHSANLNGARDGAEACVIAFDGKTLKGSFDNFNDAKAKQVLSAFAVDTALVLAYIEIDEKSNEIPALQKLLAELDVAGRIVTCDAMHSAKKTFEVAAAANAHLIVQLKDNQPILRHDAEAACADRQAAVEREARRQEPAQSPRNPSRRRVRGHSRRSLGRNGSRMWRAIIRVERTVLRSLPATGSGSAAAKSRSICPAAPSQPKPPQPQSANTGE